MKDALGIELKLGQRVVISCNSRFKVGILYNYRPNRGKYFLQMVEFVANKAAGIPVQENDWRHFYYTQERVEEQSHKYYIRFSDNKTRTVYKKAVIGINNDLEIDI